MPEWREGKGVAHAAVLGGQGWGGLGFRVLGGQGGRRCVRGEQRVGVVDVTCSVAVCACTHTCVCVCVCVRVCVFT
jgi:hypothetical protein